MTGFSSLSSPLQCSIFFLGGTASHGKTNLIALNSPLLCTNGALKNLVPEAYILSVQVTVEGGGVAGHEEQHAAVRRQRLAKVLHNGNGTRLGGRKGALVFVNKFANLQKYECLFRLGLARAI